MFTAVECGVDVFDSACVYTATEKGCAFTYHNKRTMSCSTVVENDSSNSFTNSQTMKNILPSIEIDLNNEKYVKMSLKFYRKLK